MDIIEHDYVHDQDVELTPDDIRSYLINDRLMYHLEKTRERLSLSLDEFRVLDFGCGRGQAVAALRLKGIQAYGLETYSKWIEFAIPGFEHMGLDAKKFLKLSTNGVCAEYPDEFFHFVFSSSVFEHVDVIEEVVAEIDRLTVAGGSGFHQFIGHRSVVEGHLGMPFVHWFPKNAIRRIAIRCCLLAGFDPKWKVICDKSFKERADYYYAFSVNETFYRPPKKYLDAFSCNHFHGALDILDHPKFRESRISPLLSLPFLPKILESVCAVFKVVVITTVKPE